MGQLIYPEPWEFCCRQEPVQIAETGWIQEVVHTPRHGEPSGNAPARIAIARLRLTPLSLDHQPHRRGVVVAVTLLGVTSYVFLALAATLYYNCPYQTPPSILIRTIIRYLSDNDVAFACSLRSLLKPPPFIENLRRILWYLHSVVCRAPASFHYVSTQAEEAEHIDR